MINKEFNRPSETDHLLGDASLAKDEIGWKPNIDFNSQEYVSFQTFYHSKDSTRIPITITHKKGFRCESSLP